MTPTAIDIPIPGEFIREELEARGWSQRDLAYVLGMAEGNVNRVIAGKVGITANMARALAEAFDVSPEFFMNLQSAYDLAHARAPDPAVAKKAKLQSVYPIREMIKRGWLVDGDTALLEAQMIRFFRVQTVEEVLGAPRIFAAAAKKTDYDGEPPPEQLAWLYRVRQIASEMVGIPKYSEKALREALPQLRALMTAPEEIRHVARILAECGVRFVVVEALPGAKIDGVSFWIGGAPIIGLSLRFDRIDNFWFVLRHEIEHTLKQHAKGAGPILDDLEGDRSGQGTGLPEDEREANAAASEFCVPEKQMASFIARKRPFFAERDILGLARVLHVHPGIVVGQFHHHTREENLFKLFRKHLVKIREFVTSSATVDGWGTVHPVLL